MAESLLKHRQRLEDAINNDSILDDHSMAGHESFSVLRTS